MSAQPVGGARFDHLADWLRKARFAASLPPEEPWPAWSMGETLAVALILHHTEMLAALDYTRAERCSDCATRSAPRPPRPPTPSLNTFEPN